MEGARSKPWAWKAVLIVLLTFIAYLPAMQGGFVWDDDDYVTDNGALRSLDGLCRIWFEPGAVHQYYPVVYSSFWLDYHLWGLNPLGYHIINVLLHAANAVLLGLVLRRLAVPGAWFAAAIFALHPVHVESVAWITERKNVLSGFFYLLSVLSYLRFSESRERRSYAYSLAFFVCALLSKSVTASLPVILLLLVWWKRDCLKFKRDVMPLAPFFGAGLAMGVVTIWMERHSVGAQGADWAISFANRVMIAGRDFWFYVFKLAWPDKLTFIYPRWDLHWGTSWEYLLPAAALGLLAMLWIHREKAGKGAVVAVTFFALTLLPALGFINFYPMIYSFVADHFQYLASIGLIALFAAYCSIHNSHLTIRKIYPVACAALVLLLALLTWQQAQSYRDVQTLWLDTLRKNPSAWMAHNNLGNELADEGRSKEAIAHYFAALKLKPDHEMAHYNLGIMMAKQGKLDEAAAHYMEAIRINPDYAQAHNNMGSLLCQGGQVKEGIKEYMEALRINPEYADVHSNMGVAYLGIGDIDKALFHCQEAIRLNPDMAEAYNNLGTVQVRQGKIMEAVASFQKAVDLNPDYATAHANLGRALTELGRTDEAVLQYQAARRLDPNQAPPKPPVEPKKGKKGK